MQDSDVLQEGGSVRTAVRKRELGVFNGPFVRAGPIGQRRRQDLRHKSAPKQGCESCQQKRGRRIDSESGQPERLRLFRRRYSIHVAAGRPHGVLPWGMTRRVEFLSQLLPIPGWDVASSANNLQAFPGQHSAGV